MKYKKEQVKGYVVKELYYQVQNFSRFELPLSNSSLHTKNKDWCMLLGSQLMYHQRTHVLRLERQLLCCTTFNPLGIRWQSASNWIYLHNTIAHSTVPMEVCYMADTNTVVLPHSSSSQTFNMQILLFPTDEE